MMSDEEVGRSTEILSDQMIFMEALHEVIMLSGEAEVVRIAMSAMTRTDSGLNYIRVHPMIL